MGPCRSLLKTAAPWQEGGMGNGMEGKETGRARRNGGREKDRTRFVKF